MADRPIARSECKIPAIDSYLNPGPPKLPAPEAITQGL